MTCSTAGAGLRVHFNLLTGELLVNGLPLDRPPKHYESQKLFRTLFGHHAVEVMPTAVLGMQFSTKKKFEGHNVHLGMTAANDMIESELVVQASKDVSTWETIPSRLLTGKYPPHFADEFVHWYDFAANTIEFRPVRRPWDARSEAVWRLSKSDASGKWKLERDDRTLIGLDSKTSLAISSIFGPLSSVNHIHICLSPANNVIDIEMRRLEITFSLDKASSVLRSKQFRGMRVDEDQSIGTLFGFQNKLLLKNDKNGSRQLLLPEAQVSYTKITESPARISVRVDKDLITKLHVLDVDVLLGRLVDNGSLHGKLFLAYLHALTSFCLPDPLTGTTGTEQALSILASAAVRSFSQLTKSDADVLVKIAQLTPKRKYYPTHLRAMQDVTWDSNLSFLTQRGEFADIVSALLNQASATRVLYPDVVFELPQVDVGNWFLLARDLIRSSSLKVATFGAERHTTIHDKFYDARDRDQSSQRAEDVYSLSKLVYSNIKARHWPSSSSDYLWNAMNGLASVYAPEDGLRLSKLRYDSAFIAANDTHLNSTLR